MIDRPESEYISIRPEDKIDRGFGPELIGA
jgi:hypothetical protein